MKFKLDQQQLKSHTLQWAHEIEKWSIEWRTGIYPGEMAAFLGLCDLYGIRSIIESGRGEDAYSTQILGEYSQETNTKIVSIDFSTVEGKTFQERLKGYPHLQCIIGDAFEVLPFIANNLVGPIALLVDGPKLRAANRFSFTACLMFDIQVVAHHNCPLLSSWGKEFSQLFPGAFHYEGLGLVSIPEWQEFKKWEREWVHGYEAYDEEHKMIGRSLYTSSLAMAILEKKPSFYRHLLKLQLGSLDHNPLWLRFKWAR